MQKEWTLGRWLLILIPIVAGWQAGIPGEEEGPAKFNRVLRIGSSAPTWEKLPDTSGQKHSLSDLQDRPVVVIFFTRNHCPISKKYAERIKLLCQEFDRKEVAFVAVNVSQRSGEDLERMRTVRTESGWEFPYLKDDSGKLAERYGASVTPQFFILDPQRHIFYTGAFDDHQDIKKVQEPYLRWGIEQVLAGKMVEIPETLPIGCPINEAEPTE